MTVQSAIGGGAITAILGVGGAQAVGAQQGAEGPEVLSELAFTGVSRTALLVAAGVILVTAGLLVNGLARRHEELARDWGPRAERTTEAKRAPPRRDLWRVRGILSTGTGMNPSLLTLAAALPFDRSVSPGSQGFDAALTSSRMTTGSRTTWRHRRPTDRSQPKSMAQGVAARARPPTSRWAHRKRRGRHAGRARSGRSPTAPA